MPNLVESAGEELKRMNPYPQGNPGSRCATCAVEVAQVLTQGRDARPIVSVEQGRFEELVALPNEFTEQEAGTDDTIFQPGGDRAKTVWAWLLNEAGHGRVYIARGGGHIWNFVKDLQGRIYLIDMSMRLIKQIGQPHEGQERYEDFTAPGSSTGAIAFDYLDPVDLAKPTTRKPLKIFPCRGVLHPRWTPPPPPGNQ